VKVMPGMGRKPLVLIPAAWCGARHPPGADPEVQVAGPAASGRTRRIPDKPNRTKLFYFARLDK
jgi:hypothetical protein